MPNHTTLQGFREFPDYAHRSTFVGSDAVLFAKQITSKMLKGYDSKTATFEGEHQLAYRGIQPKVGEYIVYYSCEAGSTDHAVLVTQKRLIEITFNKHSGE